MTTYRLITNWEIEQLQNEFRFWVGNRPDLVAEKILRRVQEREGPTVSTKFAKINGVLRPLWFVPEPPK